MLPTHDQPHDMLINASLPPPDLDQFPDIVTSTQPARVKYKRLSKDGRSLLLEAFYTKNITRPTKQQKDVFLQQVRALPSNDHFTMKSLERWFVFQRQKVQLEQNKVDLCIAPSNYPLKLSHPWRHYVEEHHNPHRKSSTYGCISFSQSSKPSPKISEPGWTTERTDRLC
ncbi:hypothetical protein L218DRAFT_510704 [Marasmius fiardii PR-910]|nr:hypothetical protein L218DRAFT_510704 [Marasmius fiardii PR-910]